MTFHRWLKVHGACPEARRWARWRTARRAWMTYRHPGWILWALYQLAPPAYLKAWGLLKEHPCGGGRKACNLIRATVDVEPLLKKIREER